MPQPSVSLIIYAVGECRNLACAVHSALGQSYANLEVLAVTDRPDSAEFKTDSARLKVLQVDPGTLKPAAYNAAIKSSAGELIAYGDADTVYYPSHIADLAAFLSANADYHAACGDLYKTYYQQTGATKLVRAKILADDLPPGRFGLCYANHIQLVSLCHRRSMLEKTGPFNESLAKLFDWDMTRRMSFFGGIGRLEKITGEILSPVEDINRAGADDQYLTEMLMVKTTRPAKPWPTMPDLSIIFISPSMPPAVCKTLRQIWVWTYVPFEVYLPISRDECGRFSADLYNLNILPTDPACSNDQRVEQAIAACYGDYVAIVPHDLNIGPMWLENAYNSILETSQANIGYIIGHSDTFSCPAVFRREELARARMDRHSNTLRQSIQKVGIELKKTESAGPAWHSEQLVVEARACEREGDWTRAGEIYEEALRITPCLHLKTLVANAFCKASVRMERALHLAKDVNSHRPDAQSLLLEAAIARNLMGPAQAIPLLIRAEEELKWKA